MKKVDIRSVKIDQNRAKNSEQKLLTTFNTRDFLQKVRTFVCFY